MDTRRISKYISYLLRHHPETINLQLDDYGWASIDELIGKTRDFRLTYSIINEVVSTNDKQRFSISEDGKKIRANQGHSIPIKLDLEPVIPPDLLFHGTATRFIDSINKMGLVKGQRHHVHLSENEKTAKAVGSRHGKVIILKLNAKQMYEDGFEFFKTVNNVWLVDNVPVKYLDIPEF